MPVIELTVVPPSLMSSLAMCEWQSMMPGETNLPVTSMTSAPRGIGDVRADRGDLAVAQHDRAVRDGAVRDRQDRRAAKRDDAGGSGRRLARQPRDRDRQHRDERSNEKRPPGQIAAGHDYLQRG